MCKLTDRILASITNGREEFEDMLRTIGIYHERQVTVKLSNYRVTATVVWEDGIHQRIIAFSATGNFKDFSKQEYDLSEQI